MSERIYGRRKMRHAVVRGVAWLGALVLAAGCASARPVRPGPAYVFSWPFIDTSEMAPRGGTTRGEDVVLAPVPSAAWKRLQAAAPAAKDRAAILAMAGDYRASFDFLETVVFEPPFKPRAPYRSWGTERVYVVEDRGDFISLQHILEMVFIDEEGNRQGPFVQKHWRQDWRYEPETLHEYVGRRHWKRRPVPPAERREAWSQSVYQVDDTPRYASVGRWEHGPSFSSWTGRETGRPLPRRESSVRKDYDLLSAVNRHTIVPGGWVHEEDNRKTVLPSATEPRKERARELGVNRYERLQGFDFTASDDYWRTTAPFWAEVRRGWNEKLAASAELDLATKCRDEAVYMSLFGYAQKMQGEAPPSREEIAVFVDDLVTCVTE
ncbi:MAG: hypothetical protein P8R42_16140 [Candidatus Binatia bacterium]|nr:hypothetical protein [Candidatus Binatia bacterium]